MVSSSVHKLVSYILWNTAQLPEAPSTDRKASKDEAAD